MDFKRSTLSHYQKDNYIKPHNNGTLNHKTITSDATSMKQEINVKNQTVHENMNQNPIAYPKGEIIMGEIIDIRYDQVTLRLEGQEQLIIGKLHDNVELTIGQIAKFQVTDHDNDTLTIKYLPAEHKPAEHILIEKALVEANLPKSARNKAIVEEMLHHNMSINMKALQNVIKQSNKYGNLTPQTLVLMLKNDIPITATNIQQFESYQNQEHKLIHQLRDLTHNILGFLKEIGESNPQQHNQLHKGLINICLNKNPEVTDPVRLMNHKNTPTVPNIVSEDTSTTPTILNTPIKDYLNSEECLNLSKLLQPLTKQVDSLNPTTIGNLPIKDVFHMVNVHLSLTDKTTEELIQSPEYTKILELFFHQRWTVSPKRLTKETMNEYYKDLSEDLANLKALSNLNADRIDQSSLQEVCNNLQDNIQFMKTLNELFHYVQLPLLLEDQDTHGELYVFTKKKNLSNQKEGIRVLLQLDMTNLGPLEIHINLLEKNIKSKFYLTDTSSTQLLSSHLSILTDALKVRGYDMTAEVETKLDKTDFSKNIIAQETKDYSIKRFTFDIRA